MYPTQSLKVLALLAFSGITSVAQAAVVYTFSPGDGRVGYNNNAGGIGYVTIIPPNPGQFSAELKLAAPLAANTTTTISAETGGYDFFGTPNAGGVVSFFTPGFALGITSDISLYTRTSDANVAELFRYATVEGTLTTDATGQISDWKLRYSMFELGSNFVWIAPSPPPAGFPRLSINNLDMALDLSSTVSSLNRSVQVLDEVSIPGGTTLSAMVYDEAFGDPGAVQIQRYTTSRGTWNASDTPVLPAPGVAWILLIGAAALTRVAASGARKSNLAA